MLVSVAAKRWGVAPEACVAHDSAVHHADSNRTLAFAALVAEAAQLPLPKKEDVKLRPRNELSLGKEYPLEGAKEIVTGAAKFGADIVLPGMLIAVIARSPVVGGKVTRFDATRARAVPGVKRIVELPVISRPYGFKVLGGIAVLADNTYAALKGRAALDITWDPGDNAVYDSRAFHAELEKTVSKKAKVAREVGKADEVLEKAKRKVSAVYHTPHLAHVSMEPPAAIARVAKDGCEIWACTQDPQTARKEVAKALELDAKKVTIHVTLLGGGFGRKSKPDFIVEAARLSKEAGVPVRVQWTREDDIQHDFYHSTAAQNLEAAIDDAGKVIAWRHRTAYPSIGSTFTPISILGEGELQQGVLDVPLAIPNVVAEIGEAKAYVRIGWMRSVANVYHAFAVQSFIDEVAHARGLDPRENLLDIIGPARKVTLEELGIPKLPNYGQPIEQHPVDTARHRRVIERVTEISRWTERKTDGRSFGLAVHRSFLTYVAVVVALNRSFDGKIHVDEVWIVSDAGTIVNLERCRAQMEGAVIFGMSIALYGSITMKEGAVEQTNFRDFKIVRMADAPRAIHVDFIASDGPPGGIGEPGVPPVAPAIANAVFALTGTRVRTLPLSLVYSV